MNSDLCFFGVYQCIPWPGLAGRVHRVCGRTRPNWWHKVRKNLPPTVSRLDWAQRGVAWKFGLSLCQTFQVKKDSQMGNKHMYTNVMKHAIKKSDSFWWFVWAEHFLRNHGWPIKRWRNWWLSSYYLVKQKSGPSSSLGLPAMSGRNLRGETVTVSFKKS